MAETNRVLTATSRVFVPTYWQPVDVLARFISIVVLLPVVVWLGHSLITRPPGSAASVDYSVVAQTSAQGSTFVVRDTTIEPGGAIGWHWHSGAVVAVVKRGMLQHFRSDCTVDAYGPGESFAEPSGSDHVHDGRNLGPGPVLLEVIYVVPSGTPLAQAHNPPPECR